MLIEFFGLPGSGKSTLSRRVGQLLRAQGLGVDEATYDLDHRRRRLERLLAKSTCLARYAAADPRHALRDLVRVASTRQATPLDLGKSIFNWMFISSLVSRERSPARIVLLDQGIAQAVWSVAYAARRECWLDLLPADGGAVAHKPDLIIQVRADFRTVGDRLTVREVRASRMDALGRDQRALQRAAARGEAVIGRFRSLGVPVIEVENENPRQLASGARLVADAVVTMVAEQSPARGTQLWHETEQRAGRDSRPSDCISRCDRRVPRVRSPRAASHTSGGVARTQE
jgi:hypothetical protein